MNKKKYNWVKAQPHHVKTGRIMTRKFAVKHPGKVEWVRTKKGK